MFLTTKTLRPTGGWISPALHDDRHDDAEPDRVSVNLFSGGRMTGAVTRMIETGGKKKPSARTIAESQPQAPICEGAG